MQRHKITVQCSVNKSFAVDAVRGMFDLPSDDQATQAWDVEVPSAADEWQVGAIVGPSGSGKSTIARAAFGDQFFDKGFEWSRDCAVVDNFGNTPIREVCKAISAVGFASPPAWLKPFHVLSNGEQFRCNLARALLQAAPLIAFDEFTSLVDRNVAKIGSAALTKNIRRQQGAKKFVAVTCHYDILEWLEPDWVLDMATQTLTWGRLWRRPRINLQVVRCNASAWPLFARHHYLAHSCNTSAFCFMALLEDGAPVAFEACLPFVGRLRTTQKARRTHRLVVLPDFQGIGIGQALSRTTAAMWKALGYRSFFVTAHPADMAARAASPHWRTTAAPKRRSRGHAKQDAYRAVGRRVASFEYVGPAMERHSAQQLFGAPGAS